MLFGTRRVSDLSFASTSSTAENQRLKLSALICGLSAADNCCHSCARRSSSLLKVSQKCSQLIHMRSCFCLASGLETRNRFQNRQEKNELYLKFYFHRGQKFS